MVYPMNLEMIDYSPHILRRSFPCVCTFQTPLSASAYNRKKFSGGCGNSAESSPIPIISPDSKYFSNPANSLSAEDSSSCRTKQTMRSLEIPNDCFACLDPAINHLPQCSMISTD